jgi:hypothetical protein
MLSAAAAPSFALGTCSAPGRPDFAGLVVDDRVVALDAAGRFLARQHMNLSGTDSVLAALQAWDRNLPALHRIAVSFAGERDLGAQRNACIVEVSDAA